MLTAKQVLEQVDLSVPEDRLEAVDQLLEIGDEKDMPSDDRVMLRLLRKIELEIDKVPGVPLGLGPFIIPKLQYWQRRVLREGPGVIKGELQPLNPEHIAHGELVFTIWGYEVFFIPFYRPDAIHVMIEWNSKIRVHHHHNKLFDVLFNIIKEDGTKVMPFVPWLETRAFGDLVELSVNTGWTKLRG